MRTIRCILVSTLALAAGSVMVRDLRLSWEPREVHLSNWTGRGLARRAAHAAAATFHPRGSVGLRPLTEMGAERFHGAPGGLYPDARNTPPAHFARLGGQLAAAIRPLDCDGHPASNGRIVFLAVGMSNAAFEFAGLARLVRNDPERNPQVVLVNAARGGYTAQRICDPETVDSRFYWHAADARLAEAGVTARQVQVAWIKEVDPRPHDPWPRYPVRLERQLAQIVRLLKQRYPSLRVAYLSSRIYGGYAVSTLNPEPYAYESGFAVKWLIEAQIRGDADLNPDGRRGAVRAPWLCWGPYFWADGLHPRGADRLVWERGDFRADGIHPSRQGVAKVARLWLEFLHADLIARTWYLARPAAPARGLTRWTASPSSPVRSHG